jgi:hypothetical protein
LRKSYNGSVAVPVVTVAAQSPVSPAPAAKEQISIEASDKVKAMVKATMVEVTMIEVTMTMHGHT